MTLFDLLRQNINLSYKDAESSRHFTLRDLDIKSFDHEESKKLAFLYVDNSSNSIAVVLKFFDSQHAIALLDPKLNGKFKVQLEQTYKPFYIYDFTRTTIEEYKNTPFIFDTNLFENNRVTSTSINPNLKLLLSTSGTTGSPKFVKLSEDNIIANARSITKYLPITKEDIVPLNLPIFYSYGFSVLTSNSLIAENIICTNKDVLNKEFWNDFEEFGYSTLAGVPYVYDMLNRIGFLKKNYPSLRYMTQAGGKLSPKLVSEFGSYLNSKQKKFYVMYGQTEATARMAYLPLNHLDKSNSIGIPIPDGSFSIDEETKELIYYGPNIFGGYAENLDDLSKFQQNNSLHTGDIAEVDSDGLYYITGRLKRFAKIFGVRTNLDEIESLLNSEFSDTSFYVISQNDEKLCIFSYQSSIDANLIKTYLKDRINIHPSCIQIKYINELPLTSNGKIDYKILSSL
ncbi:MAG: hypothetical protein RLZZ546_3271 [Bacteroidota bacterium]